MDALRLSLLFVGLLIVGAIYLASRHLLRKEDNKPSFRFSLSKNPLLRAFTAKDPVESEADIEPPELTEAIDGLSISAHDYLKDDVESDIEIKAVEGDEEEKIAEDFLIVLRIMTIASDGFSGADILRAVEVAGMKYGDMGIFHLYPATSSDVSKIPTPVCSLANGVEPGSFELDEMDAFSTSGLTLFMQLPGPIDGREAFELTLVAGRKLAESLGGELCDESRSAVTAQTVSHLKEKLESWRFKSRMAQIKQRHQH